MEVLLVEAADDLGWRVEVLGYSAPLMFRGHPDRVSQVGPLHFYPRWSLFSLVRVFLLDLLPVIAVSLTVIS